MRDGVYQILHVEDDENRFINYSNMIRGVLTAENIQYHIEHASTLSEAGDFVFRHGDQLDLILLDISLDDSKEATGLSLVETVRKFPGYANIPIFVLSANVDRYKDVLEEMRRGQRIVGCSEPMGTVWTNQVLSILGRKEISVLHLSDIHEGKFFALEDLVIPERNIIQNLCNQLDKIHLVVISGDLTSMNREQEYEKAKQLLFRLSEYLRLPLSKFVFVPGNHDREWEGFDSHVFSRYLHFLRDFYAKEGLSSDRYRYPDLSLQDYDRPQNVFDELFSIAVCPEERTIIVGFNSVNPKDTKANREVSCGRDGDVKCGLTFGGEISSEQLSKVSFALDALYRERPETCKYTKIAAFHHNVFGPSHVQALKWRPTLINEGNLLRFLSECQFQFVLHGHLHYAENYYFRIGSKWKGINIISTGTFSSRDRALDANFCANKLTYYVDRDGVMADPKLHRFTIPQDSFEWKKEVKIINA